VIGSRYVEAVASACITAITALKDYLRLGLLTTIIRGH
jgi:hypothetical protein